MIRIKDSDDYITARAANPRTGQISPSVLSTPGLRTPDTPAAALNLAQASPSPTRRYRVEYNRQPNEGKRVKVAHAWLAGNGAFRDTSCADLVLPSMTKPLTRHIAPKTQPLKDDDFVVNMPSAREPQPYVYPGHTNTEIQAFEHYKRKTNRTSTDGYDRRLLATDRDQGITNCSALTQVEDDNVQETATQTVITPLNVIKRRQVPSKDTSAREKSSLDQRGQVVKIDPYRHFSAESVTTVVQCDDVQPRHASSGRQTSAETVVAASTAVSHLNQLPRIRLVHPSLASAPPQPSQPSEGQHPSSIPSGLQQKSLASEAQHPPLSSATHHPSHAGASKHACLAGATFEQPSFEAPRQCESRSCSLGCTRDVTNTCTGSRKASRQSNIDLFLDETRQYSASHSHTGKSQALDPALEVTEVILLAASLLWRSMRDFLIAQTMTIRKIFPRDLTTWEKLMIVRSLILLVIRLTTVALVAVMTWKAIGVAFQVVRLIFWPMEIIMRTARWAAVTA